MAKLNKGYNVVINRVINGVNTPIYPFTKAVNVITSEGTDLEASLSESFASVGKGISDLSTQVNNRIDGVETAYKAAIKDATDAFSDALDAVDTAYKAADTAIGTRIDGVETDYKAADTAIGTRIDAIDAAYKSADTVINDRIDALEQATSDDYVKKTQLGVASTDDVTGVATLDTTGKVPSAQLPSFVDDVVEGYYDKATGKFYKDADKQQEITGETGKIYVDLTTEKTYRWSGSIFVEISESLALGETSSTAFRGDYGKVAYDHANSLHAMVDATKVVASENNGYVSVTTQDSAGAVTTADVLVYTHPGTGTNPHGTTAADLGLGNVENKDSETIRSEITKKNVTDALGFEPSSAVATAATATNDGYMTKEYAAKLDQCEEVAVSKDAPSFSTTNGIWFEIISEDE